MYVEILYTLGGCLLSSSNSPSLHEEDLIAKQWLSFIRGA